MNSVKNTINKIRKWPINKKRTLSIVMSLFLTILVIGLNYGVGLVWRQPEVANIYSEKDNPLNKLSEVFQKNLDIIQPSLDKAFADIQSPTTTAAVEQFINDIASSSLSTSSNVVE